MAKDNKYDGTTTTIPVENTNYDSIIFQPTKPVLDSELNFISDLQSSKIQDFIRSKAPSGWLDANFKSGYDENGDQFGINFTSTSNTFIINSAKNTPSIANVNGWVIPVGGSGISDENKILVELPPPPSSGSRTDLVFLEVFKVQLDSNTSDNKPELGKRYKFGNEDFGGNNLEDNIVNASVNIETTQRTQIQYRIRIVTGVDFENSPEGLSDTNTVRAQGGKGFPVPTYGYRNAGSEWDDYGLYISGTGTDLDKTNLGTVDGYSYAIPMFKVHRRNTSSFSNSNQNGAAFSLNSGSFSDRPDGLYNDQIDLQDFEDLRHLVSLSSFNYQEIHDHNLNLLYSGQLTTVLHKSKLDSNLRKSNKGLYIDRISNTSIANVNLLTRPNNQQRYFSDVPSVTKNGTKITVDDKTTGVSGNDWVQTDVVTLDVETIFGRASSTIGSNAPSVLFLETSSGPVTTVNGTWSGLGTSSAQFTLGLNPTLTNQDLFVTYELDYALKGDKLSKPVINILRVDDDLNSQKWGIISVNDFDNSVTVNQRRREISIENREVSSGNPDYAFAYRIDNTFNNYGIGTLYSYHLSADGSTLNFTIPSSLINDDDVAYVYSCYNVDSGEYINITGVQRNFDNSLSVTLPSAYTALLRFDVVLEGGIVQYDERTQSINEIGKVTKFKLNGNGSNIIYVKDTLSGDISDLVIGDQRELKEISLGVFDSVTTCYVNGIRQEATVTIEPDTSLVKIELSFNVSVTQEIEIYLLHQYTPKSTDSINIYYDYYEYKGMTSKTNFKNNSDSYVNSKVVYHRNKLDMVTNGTGSINSSEFLPKKYEPLLTKLPRVNNLDLGDFTGTVHKSLDIMGGSYSIDTDYNTPYASGKENFLTKESVTQDQGTFKGGLFVNSAESSDGSIHKLLASSLVEVVTEDGTNNFVKGELSLKIETNYINNDSKNIISNSDSGQNSNSFDIFKVEGRPLIKLNSK